MMMMMMMGKMIEWANAQEEAFLYDKYCDLDDTETMVYNTLCSLQSAVCRVRVFQSFSEQFHSKPSPMIPRPRNILRSAACF
jgi:hypothetical protein